MLHTNDCVGAQGLGGYCGEKSGVLILMILDSASHSDLDAARLMSTMIIMMNPTTL